MKRDFIKEYVSEERIAENDRQVIAMQEGGQAPVPADAGAPQGGGPNPEEMIGAFVQAMQAGDEAQAREIAFQFTGIIAQDFMSQQQAAGATPAMRGGGVAPKMKFDKNGKKIV